MNLKRLERFAGVLFVSLSWVTVAGCNEPDRPEAKPPASSAHAAARISDTAFTAHVLRIRIAADRYRSLNGTFPNDVAQLVSAGLLRPGQDLDPWSHPYAFRVEPDSLTIISYGADGAPGGTGPSEDRVSSQSSNLR